MDFKFDSPIEKIAYHCLALRRKYFPAYRCLKSIFLEGCLGVKKGLFVDER